MASGVGLTPEQRQLLLQALIQGGSQGMADPAAALQGLLAAPGGASAAQSIVAGLRNKLLPAGTPSIGSPAGPAVRAARGLSGAEPTYAQEETGSGILGGTGPKEGEKKSEDLAAKVKEFADKTPDRPAAKGILGDVVVPPVPDVPAANVAVNRAVAASNIGQRDRDMAIRMMAMEAGGEGQKGLEAVGHVIFNRAALNTQQYGGNTLTGVVTKPSQFEPWNTRRKEMLAMSPDSPRYQAAAQAFDRVASGESPDPTNGATHFLNVGTMQGRGGVPGWAQSMSNRQVLGNHTFGNPDAYKPDRVFQARQMLGEARGTSGEPGPVRAPAQAADQPLQAPTAPTPSFSGAGRRPVSALIVHHTGGREQTADDVKAVYQSRGLTGAHLFMDRQGNISQTLGFDQAGQHIRNGQGPGRGLSNANTIGIEISAKDDSDITPEQRAAMKQLYPSLQQQFPGLKVFGHGEINPHKQATEGATVLSDLRNMGKPASEQTPAPTITDRTGPTTQDPNTIDNKDFSGITDADVGAPDLPTTDTDLGPDLGNDLGSLGGLLSGLDGGESADSGPSQLQEWNQEDAKEPEKPLIPEEDKKPSGILSGDAGSLLADQDKGRVDLTRVFSPEGMGGTGLLGRDQPPDATGFKAPVGLPTAGERGAAPSTAVGILAGAPSTGLASITPPQLKAIAQPSVPLPPPRPSNIDLGLGAQPLAPPDVPLPPRRPAGLLGAPPSLPAVDPDRMARDAAPSLGAPPIGPGMGGPNPPWQDPARPAWQDPPKPQAGLLGTPATDDLFSKLTKNAGILSGALGQASSAMAPARKPSGAGASRPLGIAPPEPLLTSGLLSNARQGIDLNRFFGLLSGRIG